MQHSFYGWNGFGNIINPVYEYEKAATVYEDKIVKWIKSFTLDLQSHL